MNREQCQEYSSVTFIICVLRTSCKTAVRKTDNHIENGERGAKIQMLSTTDHFV